MNLFNLFKKHDTKLPTKLPTKDKAWSDVSAIYSISDFTKYNPDDLIGRKGHAIYKKMMRDEQVKAVVKFKRDAITSRGYVFELDAKEYGISDDEANKRIDLSKAIINKLNGSWVDFLNGMFSAISNGYSMTEKVFIQIEHDNKLWWGINKLKLKPFDTFQFKEDDFGNIISVVQKVSGKEQKIDLSKFVHFIINPDIDEHYGESELRAAHRAWFGKDHIIKFRNIWLERHAGGFRWAQLRQGKTLSVNSPEYQSLKSVLSNIQTATGMIVPADYELNSDYPNKNVAYKEAIDDCDIQISRALLVPNLLGITPSGNTGSFSQSTNQLDAFLWTLEADSKRAEDTINEQLFKQLALVNFGDDAWPRFRFNPVSESKKMELIKVWSELVGSGAVTKTSSDESHVRGMMKFPEPDEDDLKNANNDSKPNDNDPGIGNIKPKNNSDSSSSDDNLQADDNNLEQTIVGKGLISVSSFTKSQRRVDFAVISKTSNSIIDEFTTATADIMDNVFSDLINKARGGGSLDNKIRDNIRELKVDGGLKRKLNRVQVAMLKESYSIGEKHAAFEIDKAMKKDFSTSNNKDRLKFIADDYFKIKAFKITGNFTDSAIKMIEAEILNGTKYDKTWAEVEKAIYSNAASEGLISIEQAREAMGEALGVANPDARIRTVIRTSSWDAINEARHSYFTDPDLDGFVIAYEYSSILDDRTTQICSHLDAENRGDHSLSWYATNPQFRPPNHYNCRSLLIPVTEIDIDSYTEGAAPTMQPQKGFK